MDTKRRNRIETALKDLKSAVSDADSAASGFEDYVSDMREAGTKVENAFSEVSDLIRQARAETVKDIMGLDSTKIMTEAVMLDKIEKLLQKGASLSAVAGCIKLCIEFLDQIGYADAAGAMKNALG